MKGVQNSKPTHRKHLAFHDYHERCVYHITMVCSDREPVLGRIVGETVAEARCELSPLGLEVARAIQEIPLHERTKGNDVQILAAVCMPDHVHFVLFVRQRQHHREWLMPMRGIMVAGRSYDAIGNLNLLALPRHQVHVRSRWTDEEKRV